MDCNDSLNFLNGPLFQGGQPTIRIACPFMYLLLTKRYWVFKPDILLFIKETEKYCSLFVILYSFKVLCSCYICHLFRMIWKAILIKHLVAEILKDLDRCVKNAPRTSVLFQHHFAEHMHGSNKACNIQHTLTQCILQLRGFLFSHLTKLIIAGFVL